MNVKRLLRSLQQFVRLVVLTTLNVNADTGKEHEEWIVDFFSARLLTAFFLFPYLLAISIVGTEFNVQLDFWVLGVGFVIVLVPPALIWYELKTNHTKELYHRLPVKVLMQLRELDKQFKRVAMIEALVTLAYLVLRVF